MATYRLDRSLLKTELGLRTHNF